MNLFESQVHSPAGIRLVAGLVAPFLTAAGQAELASRWGADAETLHAEAVALTGALADHGVLHAALGVWARNHEFPPTATARLGEYLGLLPQDVTRAQVVLDGWANEHTAGMIPQFPATVTEATSAVLASAIALDDTWARKTHELKMRRFSGAWVPGFEAPVEVDWAATNADRSAVRVHIPLTSGLRMTFCAAVEGSEKAAWLLAEEPEVFTHELLEGQPFVTAQEVTEREALDVAVVLPAFTTRSTLDVAAEANRWGLKTALVEGAPGLGDLPIDAIVQDAFIEVTHTGVKAAAVTAMMLAMANFSPVRHSHKQHVITFDGAFAYQITHPDFPVPLFAGTYTD